MKSIVSLLSFVLFLTSSLPALDLTPQYNKVKELILALNSKPEAKVSIDDKTYKNLQEALNKSKADDIIKLGPGKIIIDEELIMPSHTVSIHGSGLETVIAPKECLDGSCDDEEWLEPFEMVFPKEEKAKYYFVDLCIYLVKAKRQIEGVRFIKNADHMVTNINVLVLASRLDFAAGIPDLNYWPQGMRWSKKKLYQPKGSIIDLNWKLQLFPRDIILESLSRVISHKNYPRVHIPYIKKAYPDAGGVSDPNKLIADAEKSYKENRPLTAAYLLGVVDNTSPSLLKSKKKLIEKITRKVIQKYTCEIKTKKFNTEVFLDGLDKGGVKQSHQTLLGELYPKQQRDCVSQIDIPGSIKDTITNSKRGYYRIPTYWYGDCLARVAREKKDAAIARRNYANSLSAIARSARTVSQPGSRYSNQLRNRRRAKYGVKMGYKASDIKVKKDWDPYKPKEYVSPYNGGSTRPSDYKDVNKNRPNYKFDKMNPPPITWQTPKRDRNACRRDWDSVDVLTRSYSYNSKAKVVTKLGKKQIGKFEKKVNYNHNKKFFRIYKTDKDDRWSQKKAKSYLAGYYLAKKSYEHLNGVIKKNAVSSLKGNQSEEQKYEDYLAYHFVSKDDLSGLKGINPPKSGVPGVASKIIYYIWKLNQ